MIFQFTGLSGAGKTTLAKAVQRKLETLNHAVKVLDGDEVRKELSKDLGFSRADRVENMKRMGALANESKEELVIISAINPYQEARDWLKDKYHAKLIWIDCSLEELVKRDTKGLYQRAMLPKEHHDKIHNLTGVNDPFELPLDADLKIETEHETIEESVEKIVSFVLYFLN